MKQETLDLIHRSYQESLALSSNIMQVVENLYEILSELEVDDADSASFDSFIDGLRGCLQYRRKTFMITNMSTYINITFMYMVIWLNSIRGINLDIEWCSRRKALESDLTKILKKSNSNASVLIRDRFGLRGILLNTSLSSAECDMYIHCVFDSIVGILACKNRKLRKEFIEWYKNNPNILSLDKNILDSVLDIPFSVDFIKDYIKTPKSNGYQSLQFTLSIPMYSETLPGCQLEVQLRSKEMHENAVAGTASHANYKNPEEDVEFQKIKNVFVIDDFSKLHITGFSNYEDKDGDRDGIHYAKEFSDRRISTTSL